MYAKKIFFVFDSNVILNVTFMAISPSLLN